jgi:hypothetical protein
VLSRRHRGVEVTPQLTHWRLSLTIIPPEGGANLKSKGVTKAPSAVDEGDGTEAGSVDEGRHGGGDRDSVEAGDGTMPLSLVAGDGTEVGWYRFQLAEAM